MNLSYPDELPISAYREQIIAALQHHQTVVVCGDTGSGKTTQLPKMLLELGSSQNSARPTSRKYRIACTQPRRLAAVTMAERVAAETGTTVGDLVGYRHRFGRKTSNETQVTFMTDGVLLAETRHDPWLKAYDAIIIDEAHERSLNVDFLLGIIKRILSRRRDLRVIVSSATLDVASFAKFFGHAPVISVPGRLFPIELKYLPPPEDDDLDLPRDVAAAVELLPPKDDILVFLPGEHDIRETAAHLSITRGNDEIIPLLASLPASEQQRAFHLSTRRRIVLATNVAETSVTIPGIRAVIDSGLARISRFIPRTQVQRLQIESISQASARQRMGRCGRLGPGTCIRLYSEEDFLRRDAYTPPEILRSSLAGVILAMLDLNLGDIEDFPFLEPPKSTAVREGLRELLELGAITHAEAGAAGHRLALTGIGRRLAKLPVEPRLARMLLAAADNAVLTSALPVVAAMSCDDPRRRPVDEREKATQAHAAFRVAGSDFLGTLKLWDWWERETKSLSQSKARALAKKTYLSYPKMREWRDLVQQLARISERLGLSFSETRPPPPDPAQSKDAVLKRRAFEDWSARFHRALLSGLLGRIGRYNEEDREYRGAHGLRFILHPSSVLTKKRRREDEPRQSPSTRERKPSDNAHPAWIMAGELVDTARLFARNAAEIDPRWLESVAGPICRHSYHSPEWDSTTGFVRATEQVTLYGLVIVPARRCDFSHVNPALAKEIFIRRGLIDGEFPRPPPEVRENLALLNALRRHAEKLRRPEFFDAEKLESHFAAILPPEICNADALRKWLRQSPAADRFKLRKSEWWPHDDTPPAGFPDSILIGGAKMQLSYRHTPEDDSTDGITCTARKSDAAALRLWRADYLVPGALPEKLLWMLSVLPSAQRHVLSPLADTVSTLMAHLKPGAETLAEAVCRTIYEQLGFKLDHAYWERFRLPPHLKVRFRILEDHTGRTLAVSRDLEEALRKAGVTSTCASSSASSATPSTTWNFGTIPASTSESRAGWKLEHYPALTDGPGGVTLRLYSDLQTAERVHALGVARLYLLELGEKSRLPFRLKDLPPTAALYLKRLDYANDRIADDLLFGAVKETLIRGLPPVRDQPTFRERLEERRNQLMETQFDLRRTFIDIVTVAARLADQLDSDERLPDETAIAVNTQLVWLVCRGFPSHVPLAQIAHFPRYLKGAALRLERARNSPSSDREKEARFAPYWRRYVDAVTQAGGRYDPATLAEYRWLVEEYRISVFAQELRTAVSVSPKRLDAKWAACER